MGRSWGCWSVDVSPPFNKNRKNNQIYESTFLKTMNDDCLQDFLFKNTVMHFYAASNTGNNTSPITKTYFFLVIIYH